MNGAKISNVSNETRKISNNDEQRQSVVVSARSVDSVLNSARKISSENMMSVKRKEKKEKVVIVKTVENPSGLTAKERLRQGIAPEVKVQKLLEDAVFDNDGEAVLGYGYQDLHKRHNCACTCDINYGSFRTPMGLALFTAPYTICPLIEMETRRYGGFCLATCPLHFIMNPLTCFQGAFFWWPCVFIPRCFCDYTPIYLNSKQTCDVYRALDRFTEYVFWPTVRYPRTFLVNILQKNANAEIIPPAKQKEIDKKRKKEQEEAREKRKAFQEAEKQRIKERDEQLARTSIESGFAGSEDGGSKA